MKKVLVLSIALFYSFIIYSQGVSIDVPLNSQQVEISKSVTYIINITPTGGFNQQLFLSVINSNLPSGTTTSFSANPVNSPYSNVALEVSTTGLVTEGIYSFTIKASNGPVESSTECQLEIISQECDWKNFTAPQSVPSFNGIAIDTKDSIWITTDDGLYNYYNNTWTRKSYNGILNKIVIDKNDHIWLTSKDDVIYDNGLVYYDGISFKSYTTSNSDLLTDKIAGLELDDNNNVWITTDKGLIKFDKTFWSVYSKSTNPLSTLKKDRTGKLWISTKVNGPGDYVDDSLYTFDGSTWSVIDIYCIPKGNDALYNSITDISFDKNNNLWYTQYTQFATIVSKSTTKFESWSSTTAGSKHDVKDLNCNWITSAANSILTTNVAREVFVTSNDTKWFALGSPYIPGDLLKYDGTNWQKFNPNNSGFPGTHISGISEDSKGNLWVISRFWDVNKGTSSGPYLSSTKCANTKVTTSVIKTESKESLNVDVFPNPTSAVLYFDLKDNAHANVTISIYNELGKEVYSNLTKNNTIDISFLPNGIYFVKIVADEKMEVKKIIKNN